MYRKHRKVINESLAEPDGACSSGENAGAVVDLPRPNLEIPIDVDECALSDDANVNNKLLI